MDRYQVLQEIIGVDKKNPCFSIYKSPEHPGKILVFYGAELLEIVDEDKDHPNFKHLMARLYNANVSPSALRADFGIPYSTLRRWGQVIREGTCEEVVRMLRGRGQPTKLTKEVLRFAEHRFGDIYSRNRYSYSQQIRQEIAQVFDITISGEALRPHFKKWKRQQETDDDNDIGEGEQAPFPHREEDGPPNEKSTNEQAPTHSSQGPPSHRSIGLKETKCSNEPTCEKQNPNSMVDVSQTKYRFVHHAGVLIFSALLHSITATTCRQGRFIKQWVASVLLKALNLEQTKLLDYRSLKILIGDVKKNLRYQRQILAEFARTESADSIWKINGESIKVGECCEFYYDPHSKPYTGMHKILKGWCSALRSPEKIMNMDFIHTYKGQPVYASHKDSFHDLRERFMSVMTDFRRVLGLEGPMIIVIDRGIYGLKVFQDIINDDSQTYFVTWEKGYQATLDEPFQADGRLCLSKPRNNDKDLKIYNFQYREGPWRRDARIRCIIVRCTNPKGRTIEVSILTNHLDCSAQRLIELMFSRWLQENDFKYLNKHFGINEITSYATSSYEEIAHLVDDKQIKSGEYHALEKKKAGLKKDLQAVLLREHEGITKHGQRQQDINECRQRSARDPSARKQLTALERQHKNAQARQEGYATQKQDLTRQLQEIDNEFAATAKESSRLEGLIEQGYKKLDPSHKEILDAVKVLARNGFYEALAPFKKAYNNFRDDHALFRNLTQAHGFLKENGDTVEVVLFPTAHLQPKVIGIIDMILQDISSRVLMPDGSGRRLHLRLRRKHELLSGFPDPSYQISSAA